MEYLTLRQAQSVPFFPKSGHFFRILERVEKASLIPPSCASVSVADYSSISLNEPKYTSLMPEYISICLNVPQYD